MMGSGDLMRGIKGSALLSLLTVTMLTLSLTSCGGSSQGADAQSADGCAGATGLIDKWNQSMNGFTSLPNPGQSDVDAVMSERSQIASGFGVIAQRGDPDHPELADAAKDLQTDLMSPIDQTNFAFLAAYVVAICNQDR